MKICCLSFITLLLFIQPFNHLLSQQTSGIICIVNILFCCIFWYSPPSAILLNQIIFYCVVLISQLPSSLQSSKLNHSVHTNFQGKSIIVKKCQSPRMKILTFLPSQSHRRNMVLPWILTLAWKVYGPRIIYLWSLTPCLLFSFPLSLTNLVLLSGLFLMPKMRG